jgi:hypothetical protein
MKDFWHFTHSYLLDVLRNHKQSKNHAKNSKIYPLISKTIIGEDLSENRR